MKDHKDIAPVSEVDGFFDKVEKATPTQISQAVIAKILLELKKLKK